MLRFIIWIITVASIAIGTASTAQAARVTIGTSQDPNNGAQVLIAEKKGFFKDEGLDASVKYFPSGGDLMAAFVGGSVDFGSSGAIPILTLRARPFPLKVIAQTSDISGAQHLVVKEGVNSLKELKGKKIGVMLGTASEALYKSILREYELDANAFTVINMAPTDMTTAFVRGDVDAIVLWEPAASSARDLGKGKVLISGTYDFRGKNRVSNRIYGDHAMLFTNEETLKNREKEAAAVIRAIQKASKFIETNRDEAINILADQYKISPKKIGEILEMNNYSLEINDELVSDLNTLSEFLLTSKRISVHNDPMEMIDTSLLRKLNPSLVNCRKC